MVKNIFWWHMFFGHYCHNCLILSKNRLIIGRTCRGEHPSPHDPSSWALLESSPSQRPPPRERTVGQDNGWVICLLKALHDTGHAWGVGLTSCWFLKFAYWIFLRETKNPPRGYYQNVKEKFHEKNLKVQTNPIDKTNNYSHTVNNKISRIRETLNLLTSEDSSNNTKKSEKIMPFPMLLVACHL